LKQFLLLAAGLVLILLISALYVVFGPVRWEGPKKVVEVRQGEGARVVARGVAELGRDRVEEIFLRNRAVEVDDQGSAAQKWLVTPAGSSSALSGALGSSYHEYA